MTQTRVDRLILGIVLGVLLAMAAAYYMQGQELSRLRVHHARAHQLEIELRLENERLQEQLRLRNSFAEPTEFSAATCDLPICETSTCDFGK
ncbi:MAG: hypothetical protein OHK0029_06430 [Armatimonadaceae bacterium]